MITSLKRLVRSIPMVGPFLQDIHRRRWQRTSPDSPAFWIAKAVTKESAQVVQIGSNDGKRWDPVHHLILENAGWSALFVEPVPCLFEQLQKNYPPEDRFRFENALINDGQRVPFYWVNEAAARAAIPNLPEWSNMLASMNREHIVNHMKALDPFICETVLDGLSIQALLEKHGIKTIDILHIDTEGADYLILSQLDLALHRPSIICYEQCHLSPAEREASIAFLQPFYDLYLLGGDHLAIERGRAGQIPELTRIAHLKLPSAPTHC